MSSEALNCPNCGAGVASDKSRCDFCKTRLKTVGCSKCLGLMFVGSKFCGHCGASASQLAVDEKIGGECPRCNSELENLRIEETLFRGCADCNGLWLNVQTFENICMESEKQSAVLTFLASRNSQVQLPTKINYVPCPDCKKLMNRNNFARVSGVIIDTCKQHGVWFDAAELPTIIEFIQKGGMEIARQRERSELRDEREKLRDDRHRQAQFDRRFGVGNVLENDSGSSIRVFIRDLFD